MSKFIVEWATGNEICVNCAEKIEDRFVRLHQNRWAKPCLCKKCLKDLLKKLDGEIVEEPKKKIVYNENTITKNSWMTNF
jgi:hypothetical protein